MAEDGEDRRAHLEMIQGVIGRMSTNSFSVKSWAVGLVAGVFALAASKDATTVNPSLFVVALVPILAFWGLDAYYLWQEKLFRALYDDARRSAVPASAGDFSMSTEAYTKKILFRRVVWAGVLRALYLPLAALVVALALVLHLG